MRSFFRSSLLFAVFAGAVLGFSSTACLAKVIYVKPTGSDSKDGYSWVLAKATVQAAINAASSGDEVWVAAGTYVQSQTITLKDGVALYGGFAGGETARDQRDWVHNVTTLDGNQATAVVTCPANATAATTIDGFTIENGISQYGGGLYCDASSAPTIAHNTITGNTAQSGGGICAFGASPVITNNTISSNTEIAGSPRDGGGGIACLGGGAMITNNLITQNTGSVGGGVYAAFSTAQGMIKGNTITDNKAESSSVVAGTGGGIACDPGGTVADNVVSGNTALDAGGIASGGGTIVTGNSIDGNTAGEGSGVWEAWVGSDTIVGNVIARNSGDGIYCEDSSPRITGNTIENNQANGINTGDFTTPVITANIIANNIGYGIYSTDGDASTIIQNTIVSNASGVSCNGGAAPIIDSNVIAYGLSGYGIYRSGAFPKLSYNCVYGNPGGEYGNLQPGPGDISADPLFVDAAHGNFHLRPESPCIDKGDPTAPPDPDGTPPDIGAFPYFHLGAVKTLADASPVSLTSLVATMGADDGAGRVYFQDLAGASGIWVQTSATPNRGATEDVTGTMATDPATGERYIAAATLTATTAENPPNPLTLRPEWLGGGNFGTPPLGQPGVTGGSGLNNIGLLVRTFGRVTAVDATSFTLDDGSAVDIHVLLPGGVTAPSVGSFVAVTGISDCEKVGSELHRLLRVRGQGAITGL